MNYEPAKAVPLVEQLRSVPLDAKLQIDTPNALGCMDTQSIPVGRLCHEAARALLAELQAVQAGAREHRLNVLATFAHEVQMGAIEPKELPTKAHQALERAGLLSLADVVALGTKIAGDRMAAEPTQGIDLQRKTQVTDNRGETVTDGCCGRTMALGCRCEGCPYAKPGDNLVPRTYEDPNPPPEGIDGMNSPALTAEQEAFCDSHCCWSGHHKDCPLYDPPTSGVQAGAAQPVAHQNEPNVRDKPRCASDVDGKGAAKPVASPPQEFWGLLYEWADSSDEERRDAIEHRFGELFALAGAQEPPSAGWQVVPVEPTEAMVNAYLDCQDADPADGPCAEVYCGYRAMLSAAPKEPQK